MATAMILKWILTDEIEQFRPKDVAEALREHPLFEEKTLNMALRDMTDYGFLSKHKIRTPGQDRRGSVYTVDMKEIERILDLIMREE